MTNGNGEESVFSEVAAGLRMERESNLAEAAGFGARFMALMIDSLLLGFMAVVSLSVLLSGTEGFAFLSLRNLFALAALYAIFWPAWLVFFAGAYFVVLHSCGGQTLGKIFMGIQVVSTSGSELSMGSSFLRLVGYLLSALPFGAGFLWAVLDKEHSSWHDRLAGSRVISF
ncbi:MAG: RDD family protein [Pseudomonadota bacterium]